MTIDPQTITYVMIGGIGFVAALLIVIIFTLLYRRAPGAGGLLAARNWLMGKKTYVLAGALMLLGLAKQQGYIDLPTYDRWAEFLTGGAILTFKAALGRVEARLTSMRTVAPVPAPSPTPTLTGTYVVDQGVTRFVPTAAVMNPIPPPWSSANS